MLDRGQRNPEEFLVAARETLDDSANVFLINNGLSGLKDLQYQRNTIMLKLSPHWQFRDQAFPADLRSFVSRQLPDPSVRLNGIEITYQPQDGESYKRLVNLKVTRFGTPIGSQIEALGNRIIQLSPDATPVGVTLLSEPLTPQIEGERIVFGGNRQNLEDPGVIFSIAQVVAHPSFMLRTSATSI